MGILRKIGLQKTLFYFIGEIVIIITGIFLAIQLNNWNEERKNRKEEVRAIARILSDLNTEKRVMNFHKDNVLKHVPALKKILYEKNYEHLDSLYFFLTPFYNHYSVNSEYINLKSSGKLNLISYDTIRYNLVSYYDLRSGYYEQVSKLHKEFVANKVVEYFETNYKVDTTYLFDKELLREDIDDIKLHNLITIQLQNFNVINQSVNTENIDLMINRIIKSYPSINYDEIIKSKK